jgi:hypothetical protein
MRYQHPAGHFPQVRAHNGKAATRSYSAGRLCSLNAESFARDYCKEVRLPQEVLVKTKKPPRPVSRATTMQTLSESYDEVLRLRQAVQGAEARLRIATTPKPDTKMRGTSSEPTLVVSRRIRSS